MSIVDKNNAELISLVWLDSMVNATEENQNIQNQLRSIINHLVTFYHYNEFEVYLRKQTHEKYDKIILIVSGHLGQQIIEKIHNIKQIISIFVFCLNRKKNEQWAKNYKKIRAVITEVNDLLQQITTDLFSDEQKLNEPIEIVSNKDNLIYSLLKINSTIIDRRDFLNICRKIYENNSTEINNIRDFEHLYSPSQALNYFFKQTFLYRLFVKSLVTDHINMIYLLRFYAQDIENQLSKCLSISSSVYFGRLMTDDQIQLIKMKLNIQFNSYIIAKINRDTVLKALENSSNRFHYNCVLFHIKKNEIGRKFQNFILFPIMTKFKILSVDEQRQIYFIKLFPEISLRNIERTDLKPIEFAHELRILGRFNQSEEIFNRLLNQYPSQSSQIYDGLARLAQDKGLFKMSIQLYEKSMINSSPKFCSNTLNNIGCVYDSLKEYETAKDFYLKSLQMMTKDINRAMSINNIGIILAKQGKYSDALQYFQNALKIQTESFKGSDNPDLGISYANIGQIYASTNETDEALKYYQKALYAFRKYPLHKFNGIVYQNIGKIFFEKKQLEQALASYEKAEQIFRKTCLMDSANFLYSHWMIEKLKLIKSSPTNNNNVC